MLPIIQQPRALFEDPNTSLREPCTEVVDCGDSFQKQVDAVIEAFHSSHIAVGLAAPQVGIQQRFTVVNVSKGKTKPDLVLVNPQLIEVSDKTESRMESCMSLPHFRGPVVRPIKVTIAFQDRYGEPQSMSGEGFLARVFCHEIDHLNGVLYVDKMEDLNLLEPVEFFREDS